MPKTLRAVVEIEVDELPASNEWLMEDPEETPPELGEYEAKDVAEVLENIDEHTSAELFGGSNVMLQFNKCKVIEAAWKQTDPTP